MQLINTINKEAQTTKISFNGNVVFPLDIPTITEKSLIMKNVTLFRDSIGFDLDLSSLSQKEIENAKIKIVLGKKKVLDLLEKQDFPEFLTEQSRRILLETEGQKNIYQPKKELNNLKIPFSQGDELSSPIKIFVILVISSRVGIVNFFSINKNDVQYERTQQQPASSLDISILANLKSPLSILQDQAYVSDLEYSYSPDGVFSGFYGIDAQKFVDKFAKFPHLIDVNDAASFSSFLLRTECCLLKYDNLDYGHKQDGVAGPAISFKVDNIAVGNSENKLFYNFVLSGASPLVDYQAKLIFSFKDVTIDLAKEIVEEINQALLNNERTEIGRLMTEIFGENVPNQYADKLFQINLLSDVSFRDFVDEVVSNLKKEIGDSQQKTVANQNIKSQYMFPHPNISNVALITYEQKFSKIIKLKQEKQNNLVSLAAGNFFNQVMSRSFLKSVGSNELLETSTKAFAKLPDFEQIKKYTVTSLVDKSKEQTNLKNNINCGRAGETKEEKLSILEPKDFIELTSLSRREVDFSYLDNVGESASALIFKKLDSEFVASLTNDTKILVRLDTPEEFFDSYFYIVGNNFEA